MTEIFEGTFDAKSLLDKQLKLAWVYVKSYGFKESDFERKDGFEIYIYSNGKQKIKIFARPTGFFPDYWPVIKVSVEETKQE